MPSVSDHQDLFVGDAADNGADTAVIIVHGIGSQRRGETLTEWAEPITGALVRKASGPVDVIHSRLGTDDDVIRISVPVDGGALDVIFTEARWSESFLALRPRAVLAWSAGFVTRVTSRSMRQYRRLIRLHLAGIAASRGKRRRWEVGRAIAVLIALPLLAVLFAMTALLLVAVPVLAWLLLTVLMFLSWLPVVGKYLWAAIRIIVSFVGDSAAWTDAPLRADAMRDVVREQITRARARARRVIVIAHSQGAAVSARAIFLGPGRTPVDTLVTVGGAGVLLANPRWPHERRGEASVVTAWAATDVDWLDIWSSLDPVPAGPVAATESGVAARWNEACVTGAGARSATVASIGLDARQKWYDYIVGGPSFVRQPLPAGAVDPVVGFPARLEAEMRGYAYDGRKADGPAEIMVDNRLSLLVDHITYSSNTDQVIEPIAVLILGSGTADLPRAPRGADEERSKILGLSLLGRLSAIPLGFLVAPIIISTFDVNGTVSRLLDAGVTGSFWSVLASSVGREPMAVLVYYVVSLLCATALAWVPGVVGRTAVQSGARSAEMSAKAFLLMWNFLTLVMAPMYFVGTVLVPIRPLGDAVSMVTTVAFVVILLLFYVGSLNLVQTRLDLPRLNARREEPA